MADNEHRPTRQDFLAELESIRDSLREGFDETSAKKPSIAGKPLANNYTKQSASKKPAADKDKKPSSKPNPLRTSTQQHDQTSETATTIMTDKPLPGQRSLFDEYEEEIRAVHKYLDDSDTKDSQYRAQSSSNNIDIAKDENPFLPQHIKDRLSKEREYFQQIQSEAQESLTPTKSASSSPSTPIAPHQTTPIGELPISHDEQKLIDEMVAKYLPIIENDLRERLLKSIRTGEYATTKL